MKKLVASALTAFCVLGSARVAHAANTRVIVAGPEGDPIAARLQKELVAMGFDPLRVDDAAGCSRPALVGWINETHASAAACSDGSRVGVWVVGSKGLRLADTVADQDNDEHANDVIAVRAAEVTRATLELPDGEEAPPPPPPRPVPTWTSIPPTRDAAEPSRPAKAPKPRTPIIAFGTGISAVLGADAKAPALDFDLEVRLHRYFALAARVDVPLQSTSIVASNATFKIAPAIFGAGLNVPLAASDARVIPRVGSGVGFVWLRSEASRTFTQNTSTLNTNVPQSFMPSATTTSRDDIFSPLVYLNAAASLRIAGPFRIAVEGLLGTTTYRMVVRDGSTNVAYFGQPLATLAMRGELLF